MTKLRQDAPIEQTHRFGHYGDDIRTFCTVYVPLPIPDHNVFVRTDVLPGVQSFLLGADTQQRMRAKLDYEAKVLKITLGEKEIPLRLIRPGKHLLIPLQGMRPSYLTTVHSGDINLTKPHINTCHSSYANMKKQLEHAGLWHEEHKEPLKSIIEDCDVCKRSGDHTTAPIVDIKHVSPEFNVKVELDVVFFHGKPFLNSECKKTRLSATIQLSNRESTTLWNSFVQSWISAAGHGRPSVPKADPEFDRSIFKERATRWRISLQITAAKAKWQQGIIERGNGVSKSIFYRIDREHADVALHMKVAHATFAKNIMFGNKKASSYELVYNRAFPIGGCAAALPANLKEL